VTQVAALKTLATQGVELKMLATLATQVAVLKAHATLATQVAALKLATAAVQLQAAAPKLLALSLARSLCWLCCTA
jgi:hypothetical protein